MKKKIAAICLCVCLLAVAVAGGTLAYFTDSKTATNTFTMGNVTITLDETDVANPTGSRVQQNSYTVAPGMEVTKDPIVHNIGSNGAYLRAKVNVSGWRAIVTACYPSFTTAFGADGYEDSLLLLVDQLGDGWSVESAENGTADGDVLFVLKYDGVLDAGEDTSAMFETVTVPEGLNNQTAASFRSMTVQAEAIQSDNFTSWAEAFAAYDGN